MSLFLRATALVLLMLSRAPALAAMPMPSATNDGSRSSNQNEVCSKTFKHNLSGLYGITSTYDQPLQPYSDFDVLYSKAHQAQFELETICKSTALLTGTDAYFAGVKSTQRAQEKIALELDNQVNRITDLARATIVADDVASLMEAYEKLSRETTIVKVKNRFKKPAESGYRDLNVLVKLPKTNLVAEVQLHLKAIADVKSGKEHELYEQIQNIERSADAQQRALTEFEMAQIDHMRRQSRQLYQDAWQPYITTHLTAA
ncbi:phosphoribosylglycinamide formyltransferase [Vibrio panuliri]|uniref:Phosphoribosylglycinamide formyltransferase n=1 Tax=Vibrio panuliri TaxID=1381081 RepID=A0A1Q9HF16_9VIBR|nr:phosphoribosylglycinamide formyltransferase [Vibrio panuliri]KAB1454495.1 phosphoribosylglycinamide formyltransferase [Vibrio panuliri]OLQ88325.1 phosphoribosylglycinamide formyltransferase [Vibrio panuliri]OLQ94926.1 phosphoribosylglycinamide formyltransferase [Vibrio panuliri]